MRKILTTIGLFAVLATAAALLPGSALAGQPVTQTLTPPPPAFEIMQGDRQRNPLSGVARSCGAGL